MKIVITGGNGMIGKCICKIVEKLSLTMNIPFNKVVQDTSKSDGCLNKTVSNEKFKQYYSNFTFTLFEDGLKETYKWYKNNINYLHI